MSRPPLLNDVKKVKKIIKDFFDKADEAKEPYTMSGLAYELDVSRNTVLRIESDTDNTYHPHIVDCIKRAREKIRISVEHKLLKGTNVVGAIFWLKNNDGYADVQKTDITSGGKSLSTPAITTPNQASETEVKGLPIMDVFAKPQYTE